MSRSFRWRNRGGRICVAALLGALAVHGVVITRAQSLTQIFTCTQGFGEEIAPPVAGLTSLAAVENPVIPRDPVTGRRVLRDDLAPYIVNVEAAIRLGKALFWDMQVGSDNRTACATCHFHAGADPRTRNQASQGANAQWDDEYTFAPNTELTQGAYPFTIPAVRDTDNITGSQGVRKSTYGGLSKAGAEQTTTVFDPVFNVAGRNVRQVTGRNAPSVINAVFNHRNFHDGRAQPDFNGVNPFGTRDGAARVWYVGILGLEQVTVRIGDASLASQSTGPVLNDVEMSAKGRTWPELGKKLMAVKPLGLQLVDRTDGVLGLYSASPSKGLTTTYKSMIQSAFGQRWWNSTKSIRIGSKSYTMMEANTSFFFGLAVMLYQATLVSDGSPMDAYAASRTSCSLIPDPAARAVCLGDAARGLDAVAAQISADHGVQVTSQNIINGLALFELPPAPAPPPNGLGCMLCHVGAELTSASVRNIRHGIEADDIAFTNAGFDQRLERMFWQIPSVPAGTTQITLDPMAWTVTTGDSADVPLAVYDTGYYNIGVRPPGEDAGTEGTDPLLNRPWSIVRMLQTAVADPASIKVPGGALACGATLIRNSTGYPLLAGSLRRNERTRVENSFKTPGLRNVELTGPYLHNGGKATLFQVMELYDDGGDFAGVNPSLAPLIRGMGMTPEQMRDVIAFLLALTDERVRWQRDPFDHPELLLPNGHNADGTDDLGSIIVPAVGAAGAATPLGRFLGLNPFDGLLQQLMTEPPAGEAPPRPLFSYPFKP